MIPATRVVMSGIQPSGVFHLGNILGAVQMWRKLSISEPKDSRMVFMVADLHALTSFKPPETLRRLRYEALASILACGLDPKRCTIYFQSSVPAHTELHWILSSLANMGTLGRMVQWKAKAGIDPKSSLKSLTDGSNAQTAARIGDVSLALFSYPVLQAADVLINDADVVPVGGDQAQHLELTRHLAKVFNHKYGPVFKEPETLLTPCQRVLSLRNPMKKMSKSDVDKNSCLYISDSQDTIMKKLKAAVTDSVQGPITLDEDRLAVNNLVSIASSLVDSTPDAFLRDYKPQSHMELKALVGDVVNDYISPIRENYTKYLAEEAYLESMASEGAEKVSEWTSKNLKKIKYAIGL